MTAGFFRSFFLARSSVLSVCLLQKRARSLELAPDQIRNQPVFNNPEQQQQHSFVGGTPPAGPSFFNNYYNNDNTFYRDQQLLPSFTGSSTDVDKHFAPGHQIRATTYKPTFNLHRLQQPYQQQNIVQQHQQRQQGTHNSFSFQTPTQQRDVSSSFEVVRSISVPDAFLGQPPPPQQTYSNAIQQPHGPQFYNAQTQQASPNNFNNQAINFQHQQQQLQDYNRRNSVVYTNQFANNNNGRSSSRVSFHGHPTGQSFVQYK
jgi:hypothetical protein